MGISSRAETQEAVRSHAPVLEALEPRQLLSVVINAPVLFSALDGSVNDADPAPGVVRIADDLVLTGAGSITANDPVSPPYGSASPITLHVDGGVLMEAGTSIYAENRLAGGSGGNILITVGGSLVLENGAIISSSRAPTSSGSGNGGDLTLTVGGDIDLQPGSIVAANNIGGGKPGNILITSTGGVIEIDGLVSSGPSTTVLSEKLTGFVLEGGWTTQRGGKITIIASGIIDDDPELVRIHVSTEGIIVSQGQDPASDTIFMESWCSGIRVEGLVASVSKKSNGSPGNSPIVIMRAARFIEVDGSDLGTQGTRQGRVRADYVIGERHIPNEVDLFARSYVSVTGPVEGNVFAVSANGGSATNQPGGTIRVVSLESGVIAAGMAFQASGVGASGLPAGGSKGGIIDLKALGTVNLSGATLQAVGDYNATGGWGYGGVMNIRSYNGLLNWQNGVGDVRPTGQDVPEARRGVITLTAPSLGAINVTGTAFPSNGIATTPIILALPFDSVAQAELDLLDAALELPVCRQVGDGCPECIGEVIVDENVFVDFRTVTFDAGGVMLTGPTYIGDPDLLPFFSYEVSATELPSEWEAIFDLGLYRLIVKDGVVVTVSMVGAGNNQYSPGIDILSCELIVEGDLDESGDGGGTIIVTSLNRLAGDIFIDVIRDVVVDGQVINQVLGTNGTPGDIIIKTFCGNIHTGPQSRILTIGVDHGGSDIIIVNGDPEGSADLPGDIIIEGLVRAIYKSGDPSTINVVNFKNSGKIIIDGNNDFGEIVEGGTRVRLASGLHVKCIRDPIRGTINIQAQNDIIVLGNTVWEWRRPNPGAVSVKTASNSSRGGDINVVSLGGRILAQDRAFDNANRYNDTATITLKALGDILLTASGRSNSVPSGQDPLLMNVVDSSAGNNGTGGTNSIRSYGANVTVGAKAAVLAGHGTNGSDGRNLLMAAGAVNINPAAVVNPAPSAPGGGDPILDPLAPIFSSLGDLLP